MLFDCLQSPLVPHSFDPVALKIKKNIGTDGCVLDLARDDVSTTRIVLSKKLAAWSMVVWLMLRGLPSGVCQLMVW